MYTKYKKHKNKLSQESIERFFSSGSFLLIGIIFLLIGLYYSLISSSGTSSIFELLGKLFTPSQDSSGVEVVGSGILFLYLYFIPAALVLMLSGLFARRYISLAYPASIFAAIYLIIIQIKILAFNFYLGGCYYLNFLMAAVFLFVSVFLLMYNAYIHRKSTILILTIIFFYISIILFVVNYTARFEFLFSFVILFSSLIFFVGKEIKNPSINVLNYIFAMGFFGLFWLRKFVVNYKPEFLFEFFTFGILFYLLFYTILIFTLSLRQKPFANWAQMLLIWSNLLIYVITTFFVMINYRFISFLWIYFLALALINMLISFLLNRYKSKLWMLPHYFGVIFLLSLVLPFIFHQNMVSLFAVVLSVFMIFYADVFKDKIALWISFTAMLLTFSLFIFSWMDIYLPSILAKHILPDASLIWKGIISGLVMLVVLSITKWRLKVATLPMSKDGFNGKSYSQLIYLFLLLSIFFTLGWIVFALICQSTESMIYSSEGWFISGSIFFIAQINYFAGKRMEFKKYLLYLAFFMVLLYPVMVGWSMDRDNFIHFGVLNFTNFLLHFIALALFIVLGWMTVKRIYMRNSKNILLKQGVQFISILYLIFLLCSEYDNLSILIASIENSSNPNFILSLDILEQNQYLPYSIIIWIFSVMVFVFSVFKRKSFLRGCSVFVLAFVLIKIFVFDFKILDSGERSSVFFVLGLFLIGSALLFPRLLKYNQKDLKA